MVDNVQVMCVWDGSINKWEPHGLIVSDRLSSLIGERINSFSHGVDAEGFPFIEIEFDGGRKMRCVAEGYDVSSIYVFVGEKED